MTNDQLKEFLARQKRLTDIIQEVWGTIEELDMVHFSQTLQELKNKIAADTFKIMVMGNFKNGKSTFINALLGQEILPAYAVPTTAIINEIKYGETPKAVLHFLNPLPEKMYDGIPEPALAHMRQYQMKDIPPIEMPVDEIEDYVVIPMGMEHKEALKQSPFEKVELFWPLELLKDGVEIVDSPGLNENPVRTQVTMEYLSKADAIIFVFSALAMGSAGEIAYIDDTLRKNGFGEQSLFCVVNRYDQLTNEREQQRVRKFSNNLLAPYTKHIYYTSAYKGLMGQMQNNSALLQESMIPAVEDALADYLANERGKIKLATPARELIRMIRQDVLERTIPQRRNALSTDLDVLKKRYDEAKPEIEKLNQQKELITSRTEALISNMEPDIRRCAVNYFNNLPGQIRAWVEEYEPVTKVSALHPKRDAEALADELNSFVSNKIDSETREWLSGPFSQLVNDKVESLKDSLEGRLNDFFVSLDQIKLGVTGSQSQNLQVEEIPVWKRVVAAGGGLLIGDIGVAALGATTGLSSEFAKGIALQLGSYIVLAVLGMLNPITIIGVIVASVIRGGLKVAEKATEKAKAQISDSYCEGISQNSMQLVDKVLEGAMENFAKVRDIISASMDTEIEEMQRQLENVIRDMEQGKEVVEKKAAQLSQQEERLKKSADSLDTFIFQLLK